MNQVESTLGEKKVAIQCTLPQKWKFISNLFLVSKKDGDHRPVINLNSLNIFLSCHHLKIERLNVVKCLLQQNDYSLYYASRQGFHIPFSSHVYPWITPKHRTKTGQLCLRFFAKAIDLKPLIYWRRPMNNVLKQANKAMLAKENRKQ